MVKSDKEIAKKVLEKMLRQEYIGGRHMAFVDISKGFPKHIAGNVRAVAKNLVRLGFIMQKRTGYSLRISLNPHRIDEIAKIIRDP